MKLALLLSFSLLAVNAIGQDSKPVMGMPMPMPDAASHSSTDVDTTIDTHPLASLISDSNMGPCPKTLADWKTWRRGKFMDLVYGQGFNILSQMEGKDDQFNGNSVTEFLKSCKLGDEKVQASPEFKACFDRITELEKSAAAFFKVALTTEGKTVPSVAGFPPSYTAENFKAVAANIDPPRKGTETKEVTAKNLSPKDAKTLKDRLKAALKKLTAGSQEVRVIRFQSGIIKDLESLVVLDVRPDGKQFWTHFTLGEDAPSSFLSLEVDPGKEPPNGIAAFHLSDIKTEGGLRAKDIDALACVQCHRTSPISLVSKDPKAIQVLLPENEKDGLAVMTQMNQKIAEVALSLPKGFQFESLGPPRGPAIDRPLNYLRRLASKTSTPLADDHSLSRVASSMNCVRCHDSQTVARSIGEELVFPDIFEHYVTTGHMPPGNKLSPSDRKLLSELITAEYFGGYPTADKKGKAPGIFGAWLNEPCPWIK